MKTVAFFPEAEQEIENALNASQDAAAFRQAIQDTLQNIASGRITHVQIGRSPCRQCLLTKYPYSIIYMETDDEVRVVAFTHHKRRTGYWKRRLPKT